MCITRAPDAWARAKIVRKVLPKQGPGGRKHRRSRREHRVHRLEIGEEQQQVEPEGAIGQRADRVGQRGDGGRRATGARPERPAHLRCDTAATSSGLVPSPIPPNTTG